MFAWCPKSEEMNESNGVGCLGYGGKEERFWGEWGRKKREGKRKEGDREKGINKMRCLMCKGVVVKRSGGGVEWRDGVVG